MRNVVHHGMGIDQSALKKAKKAARAERAANSFEVLALQWFDWWKSDKTEHTRENVMARLKKDIFPCLPVKSLKKIFLRISPLPVHVGFCACDYDVRVRGNFKLTYNNKRHEPKERIF